MEFKRFPAKNIEKKTDFMGMNYKGGNKIPGNSGSYYSVKFLTLA